MHLIELFIFILLCCIIAVYLSSLLRLPLELFLLLASLSISLVPGIPAISLKPELVFFIFLPPILFAAAYFTSWRDFKQNLRPISLLAIGLVVFTTLGAALISKWLIPTISWPVAFLLGAIISPPDASAATAITKKLGVPRRLVTILEGESLVNDASALVCYKFALAAALSGTFSLAESFSAFGFVITGGILCGLCIGWISSRFVRLLADSHAVTLLTIVTAFISYLAAEMLGVSGVIATVTSGLLFGRCLPIISSAEARVTAEATWNVLLLGINGFVFTLIGLQLPEALKALQYYAISDLFLYSIALTYGVMIIRFLWVFPATYLPRALFPSFAKRDPTPPWQALVLLSWVGMRGIISLAAALALPYDFPHRPLLIFLTFAVVVLTLTIPTLTLPSLLKWLGIKSEKENHREEALARVRLTETLLKTSKEDERFNNLPPEIVEPIRKRYEKYLGRLKPNLEEHAYSSFDLEDQLMRRVLIDLINVERTELLEIRKGGLVHDEVFHELERELDREELRIQGNARVLF